MGKPACVRARRRVLLVTTLLTSGLGAPAFAQTVGPVAPPPVRSNVDRNGVDVVLGTFNVSHTDVSIGGEDNGLDFRPTWTSSGWLNPYLGRITTNGTVKKVSIGANSDQFTLSNGVYVADEGNGATLVAGTGQTFIYTSTNGVVARFEPITGIYGVGTHTLTSLAYPNGFVVSMTYKFQQHCEKVGNVCDSSVRGVYRLQSINSNTGYQLKLVYAYNPSDTATFDSYQLSNWRTLNKVVAINNRIESCAPMVSVCSLTNTWPTAQYSTGGADVTDAIGRVSHYTITNGNITAMRRPSSAADDVTVGYDGSGRVSTVTSASGSWTYGYSDAGTIRTTTVTSPAAKTRVYTGDTTLGALKSVQDELGRTTTFQVDAMGRTTRAVQPEGNYIDYVYDGRGNVTTTTAVAKSGSGLPNIVTSASYPTACTSPASCNKPVTTTDARGATTDYDYDATHGGLVSVTLPAPTAGAVRPQTRYSYTRLDGLTGANSSTGIYALTGTSTCRTTASCIGGADEVRTTTSFGPNLLPVSSSSGSGDGTLTAITTATYDNYGNPLTIDGPLPGSADTVRARYNLARELVGAVGPDPDGSGPLKSRAARTTYTADGVPNLIEQGTVNSQSDADWSGFASLQQREIAYDVLLRKSSEALKAGGTTYALSQYSYDTEDRLDCAAVRMNASAFAAPPGACTLGTQGSYGPDRISRNTYDAAGQVTTVVDALGTTDQANRSTATYNLNGTQATLADGNGNLTTYEYDGFDRIAKTRYPSATVQGASSTTDYEGLTYDAGGNVVSQRLRDGQQIAVTYDALNRTTLKDVPNLVYGEKDATYSYDLLGRLIQATDSGSISVTRTYDALGRLLTDNNPYQSKALQYDLAGRLTRFTWADGNYVGYDYLVTGEVSAIRENGAASGSGVLASYAYDSLGRRSGIMRGNGVTTSYGYDPVSRLTLLTHDLAGTSADVTTTFAYTPSSQIASVTRSNDSYAWSGHYNRDDAETPNGLNQLTQQDSIALGHDGRGNVTAIGSSAYGYTSENRLATGPGVQLYHDPLGRLLWSTAGTRFDETGDHITTELNGTTNAILRRYVWAPGQDEPVTWYEGSGLTDRRWTVQDERGSVVAVADGTGNATAINKYDEYGVPASANVGRFQYTGQAWLLELGVSYYRARMYAPKLGRFMQSDPIGYAGGMNLYGYVGGDPVNYSDPSGLGPEVLVTGPKRNLAQDGGSHGRFAFKSGPSFGGNGNGGGGSGRPTQDPEVNITAPKEEQAPQNQEPQPADIVVSGVRCNATCQANLREQEWERWPILNGQNVLNPFYRNPAPWLRLDTVAAAAPIIAGAAAVIPELAATYAFRQLTLQIVVTVTTGKPVRLPMPIIRPPVMRGLPRR